MKVTHTLLLLFLPLFSLMAADPLPGTPPPNPAAGAQSMAFVGVNGFDTNMVHRVEAWVGRQLRVKTRMLDSVDYTGTKLTAAEEVLKPLVKKDDTLLVGFVACAAGETRHYTVNPTNRVAVINVTALQSPDPEKFGRRLERVAMQAAASTMEMKSCPNPRCCLNEYKNLAELDRMGRNFCPPCMVRQMQMGKPKGAGKPVAPPIPFPKFPGFSKPPPVAPEPAEPIPPQPLP